MMITSLSCAVVPITSKGAAFSPSGNRWGIGLSMIAASMEDAALRVRSIELPVSAPSLDVVVMPSVCFCDGMTGVNWGVTVENGGGVRNGKD